MKRAKRFIPIHYLAWRTRRIARRGRARLADIFIRLVAVELEIQLRTRTTPWVMIPIFGLVGALGAAAYSWTTPEQYVSTAIIGIGNGYIVGVGSEAEKNLGMPSQWWFTNSEATARRQQILSRTSLKRLIREEGLYEDEIAHMPVEDLIQQMETSDIRISPVAGSRHVFSISFAAPNAKRAQGAAWNLASQFVDGTGFSIVESASLPVNPESPRRLQITCIGLGSGLLAGALIALITKLRIWKLAAALGIAGAAGAFIIPGQYTSTALVRYDGPDGWSGMRELISAVTTDASLYGVVIDSGLSLNNQAPGKLRERLRIRPTLEPDAKAVTISLDDSDPQVAQKAVGEVISRLRSNALNSESGITVELFDPPSLPVDPSFPNRPIVAGTGFSLGLAIAIVLGTARYYKGSFPWDSASVQVTA